MNKNNKTPEIPEIPEIPEEKHINDFILGFVVLALVTITWYGSWCYIDSNIKSDDTQKLSNQESQGVFGDKFGAINSLFSGLAFAGIILTIFLQKRELSYQRTEIRETRQEFIQQNETLKKQRFENTFFQLLHLHSEIVNNLKIPAADGITYSGREFFVGAIRDLKYRSKSEYFKYSGLMKLEADEIAAFKNDRTLKYEFLQKLEREESGNLEQLSNQDIENFISEPIADKEAKIASDYENFFHRVQYNLGHYFRNLYHIFKYVHTTSLINDDAKQFYCNIVRAQLSSDELVLIFYNSLTPVNYYDTKPNLGYPNFKYLIDKYDVLQNMNERLLLDRQHMAIFNKNIVTTPPDTLKKISL